MVEFALSLFFICPKEHPDHIQKTAEDAIFPASLTEYQKFCLYLPRDKQTN